MSHKIPKRCLFPSVYFSNDLRQNVSILIAHTYRWDPYVNFGVWKRWGNKTCRSTSNKQSWASWFVKKRNLWRSGIGLNIFLTTAVPIVCLSCCRNITMTLQFMIIQNVLFHIVTHLEFCHTLAAARWRYRPPIKNLTSHYNSQFCDSFHCCFLQEAQKRLWTCLNGDGA